MSTNIVATLTANGAAMTAEVNKTFGAVSSLAKKVGADVGDVFGDGIKKGARELDVAIRASKTSIDEIRASMRATNGGIQIDTSGIRATIAAKQQQLQISEALLAATTRLAAKESDATRDMQVYLATLRATVDEERQSVAALNSKAQSLDLLQAELGATAGAQARVNAVSGQARAGMQQLSFQISDVAQSFASGVSPMVIFGQQASQVVQAVGMMREKSGGLVGFLLGPWGAVLTGAATILGTLFFAHQKAGEGAESAAEAHKTLADKLDLQSSSYRDVIEASRAYNAEQAKTRESTLASAEATARQTKTNIEAAIAIRQKLAAELAAANQTAANSAGQGFGGITSASIGRAAGIEAKIRANSKELSDLEAAARNAVVGVAEELAKLNTDPRYAIEAKFDRMRASAKKSVGDVGALRTELEKLNKQEKAALAAMENAPKALRENNRESQKLPKVTGQEVAQLIGAPITSGKRTAAQNAAAKGARNSYHLTDQAIDIPLTVNGKPLTKEGIRAALAPAGVIIKELLGPGDKGHDDHFHIAFDKKRATSDAVANDAARDAKKAQDELAASLKNVTSLFDPAKNAADEYRLQLQEIKKLEDAGVEGSGISAQEAKRYRDDALADYSAKLAAIEKTRHTDIMSNMSVELNAAGDVAVELGEKLNKAYIDGWQELTDKKVKSTQDEYDKQKQQMEELASFYERAFQSGGRSIWSDFKQLGKRALADLAAQATIKLLGGGGQSGGNGLLGSLFGNGSGGASNLLGGGSSALSGLSSAAGPAAAAVAVNQGIGKLLGNDQLKSGMLLTLIMGPFLAKLVGSAKKGSATLGFNNGELGVGSTSGNNSSRIGAAKDGIGAVGDILNQIADGVGGNVTGAGSVSLGIRKKTYVVDPTGRGRTKGAGVLKFKDEQDAIEAAVRDALQDGVIAGISDAAKRILSSGQDLQKAIQKAATIESIPKALKARLNPVGAALDALNAKWDQTIATLKEGGASAEQMADAEKLYRLEREDALKAANDNLKEFINSLNFGSSSTYSLMDQSKAARADLDKYLGNINSGNFGAVDQQKYLQSAQSFLDIQRELGGSGTGWFNSVDELRTATQKLADGLEKGSAEAAARDPFAEATASATQATADILAQQTTQLASINGYLASLAAGTSGASGGGGGSSFIGSDRSFVVRER